MRRFFIFTAILTAFAGVSFAVLRHKPWMISHLPESSASKDSIGKRALYSKQLNCKVDSIAVVKHVREMYVYHNNVLQKIYRISLGDAPIGHKHFQGDEKTPEGLYKIDGKNPFSSCHKNLGVSYPNDADRAYAARSHQPTGGDIKIHGLPNGQGKIGKAHLLSDWTNGCIAVTDEEIDELYKYTNAGVPIFIMP